MFIRTQNPIFKFLRDLIFFLFLGSVFFLKTVFAQDTRLPLTSYPIPKEMDLCGEKVPLEDNSIRERMEREFFIVLGDEAQIILWLKRSGKYFPELENVLKEKGMPQDLKYVLVAESGLLTHSYSSKGAGGHWQFIQPTGERYGLKKQEGIDERFSFTKSTEAALTYLKDLYGMFGSWTLAIAAYNCGEERIKKEIEEQKVNNFYYLSLPQETERYIFRILAIKTILSNPETYGFTLKMEDYYLPQDFDTVNVVLPCAVHLRIIAEAANTYYRKIRELNPEFKGYYLPKGEYTIRIPKGSGEKFNEQFAARLKEIPCEEKLVYIVKEGDNLSQIAETLQVPLSSLQEWNKIDDPNLIVPGQELIYYRPLYK
jgi:hypothetical protein